MPVTPDALFLRGCAGWTGSIFIMKDVLRYGKKVFSVSVASLTIAWSMGLAALVPAGVSAETCPQLQAGSLFKTSAGPAVYLLTSDMKRLDFPNADVYKTWYEDYSGVVTVPASCGEAYSYGGSVTYRPGSRLVKVQAFPTVYVVYPGNKRAKLASGDIATALYGANWGTKLRDLPDYWMNGYSDAAELTEAVPHNGQLVKKASSSDVYLVQDGTLKKVDGTLGNATKNDVATVSDATFAKAMLSSSTVTPGAAVADPSQGRQGVATPGSSTPAGGNLSVSVASDNPAASNVADGTAYNAMLKLNLTASNGAVSVKGLTITRTGLISNTNVTGVSVWDEKGMRHGDVMTSFNSDNKVVVGFSSYPILVANGDTETVTVAFNLGTDANSGTVGATIASNTSIDTNGTVTGAFPINGNIMNVVNGGDSLANVQVDAQSVGGLTNGTETSASGNVEIGETKDIAKFKFTQENGKNDITVNSVTFYLQGTAKDADLKDFTLVAQDNTVLGMTEKASDRYVTVKLTSPYTISKSQNRTLTLRATVADGSGNYVRAQVQNDYDVLVSDKALGYSLIPTDGDGTGFDAEYDTNGWFKMKSGALTVTKASDSLSGNVSAGASDLVLARFNVKAVGEDLEIRKMGIRVATTTAGSYDLSGNVQIRVGSEVLLSFSGDYSTALYVDGSQRNLSQYLTVKSGETKVLEVVGNIDSSAQANSTYQVEIGNFYAKRLSTLDFADNLPSTSNTSVDGNVVSVQTTNLTMSKDTSVGDKTVSKGGTQVVGQYIFQAGPAEEVCVTNVSVTFAGGSSSAPEDMQNLELWLGNSQYGSTISSVATSSNSFNANVCLAKNERRLATLKAYVNSNAIAGPRTATLSSVTYIGKSTSNTTTDTTSAPVGQSNTFGDANVIISAASDSSTISSIRLPGTTEQQLGKWKVETQNETVTVKRLSFQVRDDSFADDTSAGNFGTLSLYDSANMTTPIGSASYVPGTSNGYVRFEGMNWTVAADQTKYLVLKGAVNGSGAMNVNSINVFVVRSDSTTDMDISSASGATLSTSQIDAVSGDNTDNSRFATSTFYLFHNAAPVLASQSLGTTLEQSTQAQLFKFTVTNPGDRVMRMATTTLTVSASGLTNASASTGTIQSWQLWEANASGGLGTQIGATSSGRLMGGVDSNASTGGYAINAATGNAISVIFGSQTDESQNNAFTNLTIDPGSSRTFVLVADTSAIFNGKTTGSVSVSAKLDGATGYSNGDATEESNWSNGVLQYFYTPVGGSENSTAYSASDSYDVVGGTLTRSL